LVPVVIAIRRAVLIYPIGLDAEHPVHTADRTADDSPQWAGGGIAFRRAALYSFKNSVNNARIG
jgi:hypothetical protein